MVGGLRVLALLVCAEVCTGLQGIPRFSRGPFLVIESREDKPVIIDFLFRTPVI